MWVAGGILRQGQCTARTSLEAIVDDPYENICMASSFSRAEFINVFIVVNIDGLS